jgi:hypothetical protein
MGEAVVEVERGMDWKQLLGYITGSVDQELLLRNEYLTTENRILRQQIPGRMRLGDEERKRLAEIGQKLGKQVLAHDHGRLGLSVARAVPHPRPRYEILPGFSADDRRGGRQADRLTAAEPESEYLCGALGALGQRRRLIRTDLGWRTLPPTRAAGVRHPLSP